MVDKKIATWFLIGLLMTLPPMAFGGSFSRLVVFGDSLSDNGNLFAASGRTIPPRKWYYEGRSSNGLVWPEVAAAIMGIPLSDQAFAGAQSGVDNVLGDYPGLAVTIGNYLKEHDGSIDGNALYVLWAAANDYMYADSDKPLNTLTDQLVTNMTTAARRLEQAGARFIVVMTMPDLGITPWAKSGSAVFSSTQMTAASIRFNKLLIAALREQLPAALTVDAFSVHKDWFVNPAAYGFIDVSSGCLSTGCADPEAYLFWDDRHPTAKAHRILAQGLVKEFDRFAARADSFGLFTPGDGKYLLSKERRGNKTYQALTKFDSTGAKPLAGDWNGDNQHTIGSYLPAKGVFRLARSNRQTTKYEIIRFGPRNRALLPVAGDWNGDGKYTVGVYNPAKGTFHLRLSNDPKVRTRKSFRFGPRNSSWLPLAGDWNGDGIHTVGLYQPSSGRFTLKNVNKRGKAQLTLKFGGAGAGLRFQPLAGDWNGDGYTTIGVYKPDRNLFLLKNRNAAGAADHRVRYGKTGVGGYPIGGDWDGHGNN